MPGATSRKPSAPPRRRERDEEESTPRSKKANSSSDRGWGAVVDKKAATDEKKRIAEDRKNNIWDFYLRDGETAVIQFLSDEPLCYEGHNLKDGYGNFTFVTCQLENQKHCLACRENAPLSWKAAFKVLDYRKKNKKGDMVFTSDDPTEKLFKVGQQLAQQIKDYRDKKGRGKELTELMIEISRSGSGAKDTTYNLSPAEDEEGDKMEAMEWEEKFPDLSEIIAAPTDAEYEALGYVVPEEKASGGKGRK